MYAELYEKITAILTGITAIKAVYPYPLPGNPEKYPAVVFFPDSFDNAFDSNAENMKAFRFKLWVTVNLSGSNEATVFPTVLAPAVDKVIAAFDEAWDAGVSLQGHRIWLVISSGFWGMTVEQKGKEAWAELSLTFHLLSDT